MSLFIKPFVSFGQPNGVAPELTWAWSTDSVFKTVESVMFHPESGYLFTANMDGHFMSKDGKGSIGRLNTDGSSIEPNWVEGLDAPTGLCYQGEFLYTTDIDLVHQIHLATAKVVKTIPIPGAVALNDITIDAEGILFITDTGGNQIFRMEGEEVSVWKADVDTPNGIMAVGDNILYGQWTPQLLRKYNRASGGDRVIGEHIEHADGIDRFGEGAYLVTSWSGKVHWVSEQGNQKVVLNTSPESIGAADVIYIPKLGLLIVATFQAHRLDAYQVHWPD